MRTRPRSLRVHLFCSHAAALAALCLVGSLAACGDLASTARTSPELPQDEPDHEVDGGLADAAPFPALLPPRRDADAGDATGSGGDADTDRASDVPADVVALPPRSDAEVAPDTSGHDTDGSGTTDVDTGVEPPEILQPIDPAPPRDHVDITPACRANETPCGERCVDLTVSATECGACDFACEAGPHAFAHCDMGSCTTACIDGYHDLDPLVAGCEYACEVTSPGIDTCDGEDNDCDGEVDEDGDLATELCSEQRGVCAGARSHCVDGTLRCTPEGLVAGLGPYDEGEEFHCDGLDNDCDGLVDERCASPHLFLEPDGLSVAAPAPYVQVFGQVDTAGDRLLVVALSKYLGGPGRVTVHAVPTGGGVLYTPIAVVAEQVEGMTAYPTALGQEVLVQEVIGEVKRYLVLHDGSVEAHGQVLATAALPETSGAGISSVTDAAGGTWVAVVIRTNQQVVQTLLYDPDGYARNEVFERLDGDHTLVAVASVAGATRLALQERQFYPGNGVLRLYDVGSDALDALSPWPMAYRKQLASQMRLLSVSRAPESELLVSNTLTVPWSEISVVGGTDPEQLTSLGPLRGQSEATFLLALPRNRWLVAASGPNLALAGTSAASALVVRDATGLTWTIAGRSNEMWSPVGAFYAGDVGWIAYREHHAQPSGRLQIRQISPEGVPLCFGPCPRLGFIREE